MTKPKTTFAGPSPWAGLKTTPVSPIAKEKPLQPRTKPPQAKPLRDVAPFVPKLMASGQPRKPPPPVKPGMADPAEMSVTNDKPNTRRVQAPSKYEALFLTLGPGQAIKCKPEHVHSVANALRAWIKSKKLNWKTAITLDYGDGWGRVFRLEGSKHAQK